MKRVVRLILIMLLVIPFSVNATSICSGINSNGSIDSCKVSYGTAIDIANNYFINIIDRNVGSSSKAKDYDFYKRYFILPVDENVTSVGDLLKYDCRLLENKLGCYVNPLFKTGTLVSAREFVISNYRMDGSSYLLSGINSLAGSESIWTSTNSDSAGSAKEVSEIGLCDINILNNLPYHGDNVLLNSEKYKCVRYYGMTNVMNSSLKDGTKVLYPKNSTDGNHEDKAYVKAAAYLNDDVRISGEGTNDNPWVILKKYYVDPNYIMVNTRGIDPSGKCEINLEIPSVTQAEKYNTETCGENSEKLVCYENQKAEFILKYKSESDCANIKNNLDVITPTIPQFSNAYLDLSEETQTQTLTIPKVDLDIDENFNVNIQLNYKEYDITLHAISNVANKDSNGSFEDGSLEKTIKVRFNNTFGAMPAPIPNNNLNEYFDGWYTGTSCGGTKITNTSIFNSKSLAKKPNLYACYKGKTANFVFVGNGIERIEKDYSYTSAQGDFKQSDLSQAPTPTRPGYEFTGWTDNQNGQILSSVYNIGSTVRIDLLKNENGWKKTSSGDYGKYISAKIKVNYKDNNPSESMSIQFNDVTLDSSDIITSCKNGVCTYEISFSIGGKMLVATPENGRLEKHNYESGQRFIDLEGINVNSSDVEVVYVAKYDKKDDITDDITENYVFGANGISKAPLNQINIKFDYNNNNYMIANWKIKTLNVSYKTSSNIKMGKKGDGTYSTDPIVENVEFFDNYYLEVESEHNDYEFISWKNGGTKIENYTSIKTDTNHDITAEWKGQKVNVMFCPGNIGDNSDCVNVSQQIAGGMRLGQAYGQTVNWQKANGYGLPSTKEDDSLSYALRGWQDAKGKVLDPNSTASVVTKGDSKDVDNNYKVYVYAIWKQAVNFTFSDNFTGGSSQMKTFVVGDYFGNDLPNPVKTRTFPKQTGEKTVWSWEGILYLPHKEPIYTTTNCTFLGWFNSNYKGKPLDYYYDNNNDVKINGLYGSTSGKKDAYDHYVDYGQREGRKLSQYISTDQVTLTSNNITVYAGWRCK